MDKRTNDVFKGFFRVEKLSTFGGSYTELIHSYGQNRNFMDFLCEFTPNCLKCLAISRMVDAV